MVLLKFSIKQVRANVRAYAQKVSFVISLRWESDPNYCAFQ